MGIFQEAYRNQLIEALFIFKRISFIKRRFKGITLKAHANRFFVATHIMEREREVVVIVHSNKIRGDEIRDNRRANGELFLRFVHARIGKECRKNLRFSIKIRKHQFHFIFTLII